MARKRGFTLIELLVVMSIIMVLAAMLLLGINAAQQAFKRARTQTEITGITTALVSYETEFGVLPPSGVDAGDDGKLSNATTGMMNHAEAWPTGWTSDEHPLVRCLVRNQEIRDGSGTLLRTYVAPFPKGRTMSVADNSGQYTYLVDPYGNPYRYLADGRRQDRAASRVSKNEPVVWSAGLDGLEDPQDNQIDDPPVDGRVDDVKELHDDLCSWNQ